MLLPLVFGDATRVAILRLLAREPPGLTQRGIASRIGRSPSHVNKMVQAFEALGIVTIEADHRVHLNPESPLHQPVIDTLDAFEKLEGYGRYLRTVIRAANERFGDRYYVGGYLAATRTLQPIDFRSDRCDLHVKDLAPRDEAWARPLRRLSPYDLRLHPAERLKGLVEEGATLDDEPCLVAKPEVGVLQCLGDETFPRYGAFLLLVQALEEWPDDARDRFQRLAEVTSRWEAEIGPLIDYVQGRHPEPPAALTSDERRELENAISTVRGA